MDLNIKIGDPLRVISKRQRELNQYKIRYGDIVIVEDIELSIITKVRVLRTGKIIFLRSFTSNGCHNRNGTLPVYERI